MEHSAGVYSKVLTKLAVALLIGGPDTRAHKLLEVEEQTILVMKEGVECCKNHVAWYGHQHNLKMLLLAWRFMVLNDKNKRLFMRCSIIPV